jgi:hypothetical protein
VSKGQVSPRSAPMPTSTPLRERTASPEAENVIAERSPQPHCNLVRVEG